MSTHLNWNLEVEHDIKQAKKRFMPRVTSFPLLKLTRLS